MTASILAFRLIGGGLRLQTRRRSFDTTEAPSAREVGKLYTNWRRTQKIPPASSAAAGSVKTQASAMLRIVANCRPLPLAAMVPATPEDSTCVVDTGMWKLSAAMIVAAATISAAAP